jgi:hypothetical protein
VRPVHPALRSAPPLRYGEALYMERGRCAVVDRRREMAEGSEAAGERWLRRATKLFNPAISTPCEQPLLWQALEGHGPAISLNPPWLPHRPMVAVDDEGKPWRPGGTTWRDDAIARGEPCAPARSPEFVAAAEGVAASLPSVPDFSEEWAERLASDLAQFADD